MAMFQRFIALSSCALALLVGAQDVRHHAQSPLVQQHNGEEVMMRSAIEADLDDVITVFIDAFAGDAIQDYLQLHDGRDYSSYRWRCARKTLGDFFSQMKNGTFINVITIPQPDNIARQERVVSVGVWNSLRKGVAGDDFNHDVADVMGILGNDRCEEELHVNKTRRDVIVPIMKEAEAETFRDLNQTMYLALLATQPRWDGHGFGARQCQWGMERANASHVAATLIATPAGHSLYKSLGWRELRNITVPFLDGLGGSWLEYMEWDAEQQDKKS